MPRSALFIVLTALVLTLLMSATRAEDKPAKPAEAKAEAGQSLFDGKTLDGWKVSDFGGQGDIEVKDGRIVIAQGEGCSGVTWTKDFPRNDYEFSLQARREDGIDFFCGVTFPVQDASCSLIVGGWGGTVVGLSCIDGESAAYNSTASFQRFDTNKWYRIRVRVTKESIKAWIDDKQVVDQELEGHKITIRPEVEASKPFGVATWNTKGGVKDIVLSRLTVEKKSADK